MTVPEVDVTAIALFAVLTPIVLFVQKRRGKLTPLRFVATLCGAAGAIGAALTSLLLPLEDDGYPSKWAPIGAALGAAAGVFLGRKLLPIVFPPQDPPKTKA